MDKSERGDIPKHNTLLLKPGRCEPCYQLRLRVTLFSVDSGSENMAALIPYCRSQWPRGRSPPGIVGSNPAEIMDVGVL